jgi:hypothetical protein
VKKRTAGHSKKKRKILAKNLIFSACLYLPPFRERNKKKKEKRKKKKKLLIFSF